MELGDPLNDLFRAPETLTGFEIHELVETYSALRYNAERGAIQGPECGDPTAVGSHIPLTDEQLAAFRVAVAIDSQQD